MGKNPVLLWNSYSTRHNFTRLATIASYFAILTGGNISHHMFKMDTVCCAIKYCR